MGLTSSKQERSAPPLDEWSVEQVADGLSRLGASYQTYGLAIRENAIDGSFLTAAISLQQEPFVLEETFDDLGIHHRLHRRVLRQKLEECCLPPQITDAAALCREISALGSAYSEYALAFREHHISGDFLLSLDNQQVEEMLDDLNVAPRLHRRVIMNKLINLRVLRQSCRNDNRPASVSITTNTAEVTASNTSAVPRAIAIEAVEEDDFSVFDDVTRGALQEAPSSVIYCGLHLIKGDELQVLSGQFRDADIQVPRFSLQKSETHCSRFINESTQQSFEEPIFYKWLGKESDRPVISGHLLKDRQGGRLGTICILDSDATSLKTDESRSRKGDLLQQLAARAERLIQERQAIVERTAALQYQIQTADLETSSSTSGPLDGILAQIAKKQGEQSDKGSSPLSSHLIATASMLDAYSDVTAEPEDRIASPDQLSHLPATVFDVVDAMGAPRPPISMRDMEELAVVDDLNLTSITPDSAIGQRIKGIVKTTSTVFGMAHGYLNFFDQEYSHYTATYSRGPEESEKIASVLDVSAFDDQDSTPFQCKWDRGAAICNYTKVKRKTLVLEDMSKDTTFEWIYQATGYRCYVGCPLVDNAGRVLATLCFLDNKERAFSRSDIAQMEQSAYTILIELQNWDMRKKMEKLEQQRNQLLSASVKSTPPTGNAAIVRTDIESSTALWEADAQAMQDALEIHSKIMVASYRKYNGYEVATEGDAYLLAFHDPVDAIVFCLEAQKDLHGANWSEGTIQLCEQEGKVENLGGVSFRGLRVRMGLVYGPVETREHDLTNRIEYSGEAWNLSKSVEAMAFGGQIVTTLETWNLASAVRSDCDCQVVDMGLHVLAKGGSPSLDGGIVAKKMVQLLPLSLAFDYRAARRPRDEAASSEPVTGRRFPPVGSASQLSPSFHDAPYKRNMATILFLYTSELEKEYNDESLVEVKCFLSRMLGELLSKQPRSSSEYRRGYHCKDIMLAFASSSDAIRFAFDCVALLRDRDVRTIKPAIAPLIKFGCVHGSFLCMAPDLQTGRADYFGTVVNRAARVANAAPPGTIVLGMPHREEKTSNLHFSIGRRLLGVAALKGVTEEMALFECFEATTA